MPQPVIEFFYDYASPFSYLANALLPGIAERGNAELRRRPFLLGGVMKATGNSPPMLEPVAEKRAYFGSTMQRWADCYGVPVKMNPHFPITTLVLMRMATAAQLQSDSLFERFHNAVYAAFWTEGLNMGDAEIARQVISNAGLDAAALEARAAEAEVKDALRAATEEAVSRGAFGAPTCFLGEQMFFGADHLPLLEHALQEFRAS